MSLSTCSTEILDNICDKLREKTSIKNVMQTCSGLYQIARPKLFRDLEIQNWDGMAFRSDILAFPDEDHRIIEPGAMPEQNTEDMIVSVLSGKHLARQVKSLKVFRARRDISWEASQGAISIFYSAFLRPAVSRLAEPFLRKWTNSDREYDCWMYKLMVGHKKLEHDDACLALLLTALPKLEFLTFQIASTGQCEYDGNRILELSKCWTLQIIDRVLAAPDLAMSTPLCNLRELCISGDCSPKDPGNPLELDYYSSVNKAFSIASRLPRLESLCIHRGILYSEDDKLLPELPATCTRLELNACRHQLNLSDVTEMLTACSPLKTFVFRPTAAWYCRPDGIPQKTNRPLRRDALFAAISVQAQNLENLVIEVQGRHWARLPYDEGEEIPLLRLSTVKRLSIDSQLLMNISMPAKSTLPALQELRLITSYHTAEQIERVQTLMKGELPELDLVVVEFPRDHVSRPMPHMRLARYAKKLEYLDVARANGLKMVLLENQETSTTDGREHFDLVLPEQLRKGRREMNVWGATEGVKKSWRELTIVDL